MRVPVKKRVFVIHTRQAGRLRQALCNLLKPGERPETSGVLNREYLSYDFIHRVRPQGKGEKQTEENARKGQG